MIVTLITKRFNKEQHAKQYEINTGHNFYGLTELISKNNEKNADIRNPKIEVKLKKDVKQKLSKKYVTVIWI